MTTETPGGIIVRADSSIASESTPRRLAGSLVTPFTATAHVARRKAIREKAKTLSDSRWMVAIAVHWEAAWSAGIAASANEVDAACVHENECSRATTVTAVKDPCPMTDFRSRAQLIEIAAVRTVSTW